MSFRNTELLPIAEVAREFEAAWREFLRQVENGKVKSIESGGRRSPDWYAKIWADREWPALMWYGEGLVDHILKEKAIPKSQAKKLEMAARLFGYGTKRMPNKATSWVAKNTQRVDLLLQAARTWSDRQEETASDLTVGNFDIIDTVHLDDKTRQTTITNLEDVQRKLKQAGIPKTDQILYGTIYLVGKIRGNAAAWYKRDSDEVLIRPSMRKYSDQQTHFILHELAHRYWSKVLPPALQMAWKQHHVGLQWAPTPTIDIKPGTVFKDVRIKGIKGDPVIDRIDNRYVYFVGSDAKLDRMKAWGVLRRQAQRAVYPTSYAAKDPEEHFCEAFAMYVLGTLPENHREAFDHIVTGGVAKTAMISNPVIWLKNYLTMTPAEKGRDTARRSPEGFLDFLAVRYPVEQIRAIKPAYEAIEGGDLTPIDGMSNDLMEEFYETADHYIARDAWTPSYYHLDYMGLVKNQWLIHFTDAPVQVALQGFTKGVQSYENIGLTTFLPPEMKKAGGYNFAYLLKDYERYGKSGSPGAARWSYGDEAVIFRASGIKVWHWGDSEPQVIFLGSTATDITPIQQNDVGDYYVGEDRSEKPVFEGASLTKVVDWVVKHFSQYRKRLTMKGAAMASQWDYDDEDEYEDVGMTEEGFWGNSASGILFTTGEKALLLLRSGAVLDPHVWGIPGGAIPEDWSGSPMNALESAKKETREEVGTLPSFQVIDKYVFRSPGGFTFTTFIAQVDDEFTNIRLNWENDDWEWATQEEAARMRLHPGVKEVLAAKRSKIFSRRSRRAAQQRCAVDFSGVFPDIWAQLGKQFENLPDDEAPLGSRAQVAQSGLMIDSKEGKKPLIILISSRKDEDTSNTIVGTGLVEVNDNQGITIELNGKFTIQEWREIWQFNKKFKKKLLRVIFNEIYSYPISAGIAQHYLQLIED